VSLRGAPTRLTQPLIPLVLAGLLALAASGAGRQGAATAAGVGDCTPGANWGSVRSDLAPQVVGLVNQHRAGLGLGGLAESATLTAAATWKARHMAFYGYLAHDDPAPPVARSVADRLAACGYTAAGWGENVAYGQPSAAAVMQAWLGSSGHKANIERSSFRAIGVGVAAAANGTLYWTQVFGTAPGGSSPPPPPPAPPPPAAHPPPPAPPPPTLAAAQRPATAVTKPPAPAAPPAPAKQATTAAPAAPVAPAGPSSASEAQRYPYLEASRLLEWGPRPRAGQRFTGRLTINVRSTGQRVRTGRATCNARARGRPVWVGVHRFENGFVVCSWSIPRAVKNHRLIGTIRVSTEGKRTARWFSRVVR
jgi:uncharacterized protein YkwD